MIDPNIVNRQPCIPMPDWAANLFAQLCEEYDMPMPTVHWIAMEKDGVCGGWYVHDKQEIIIVASGQYLDDAHSIAHEFAHYIVNDSHSPEMYAALLDITERFEMDYDYMWKIEMGYQPNHLVRGLVRRI